MENGLPVVTGFGIREKVRELPAYGFRLMKNLSLGKRNRLVDDFVIAGFAAGTAIIKTIEAQANFNLGVAEAAITFAVATVFGLLALRAVDFGLGAGHTR
ncbi:MAG TPA: hypothetical protein VMB18_18910 [Terriglobales bacterium]|nr:hypothetical protein [Terriglobales bacterium]